MRTEFQRRILSAEPDYYIRLLLSNNSWQSVCLSSLLASELLIILAIALGLLWTTVSAGQPPWEGVISAIKALPPYLALGVVITVIQLLAAVLAKWGQAQRWSGRTVSFLLHVPVVILLFGLTTAKCLHYLSTTPVRDSAGQILVENVVLVTPTSITLIFLGSVALTYLLWNIWWRALLFILEKQGDVDIWNIISEAAKDTSPNILAEYRYCLSLRRDAAWEKKHRWLFTKSQNTRHEMPIQRARSVHPLGVILVAAIAAAGTLWWKETQTPTAFYQEAEVTLPKNILSFWFEGTANEADALFELVESYNAGTADGPLIQAHHVPRLGEAVTKASIGGTLPDILLADDLLAERVVYASQRSTDSPRVSLPVWEEAPWRPNLSVVIVKDGVNHAASMRFAEYLISSLTSLQKN